jgi:hypothetical protein
MTSQAFSMKNKPLRHAFRIALQDGSVTGIISTLLLTAIIVVPIVAWYNNPYHAKTIFYMGTGFPETSLLLIVCLAFVQALCSFQMLYRIGSANFFFGIGLRRDQLFGVRFAAGMVWQSMAVTTAIVCGAAVNLIRSQHAATDPGLILESSIMIGAGLLLTALIAYAVTALICTLSGTLLESCTYSILALILPTLVLWGLNSQMKVFLWGNAYDMKEVRGLPDHLITSFTRYNPFLFSNSYFDAFGYRFDGQATVAAPAWGLLPGWLLVSVVLIWLARRFFINRQVEKTGLRGTSKALGFILIFPLIYAIFSGPLYLLFGWPPLALSAAITIGAGLSAAMFAGLAFPLRLIDRPVWKGILVYPAYLTLIGTIIVILLTGGLGYSRYLPKADDIAYMSISYKGLPNTVLQGGYGGSGLLLINNNKSLTLNDPEDIQIALQLHQLLIDQSHAQPGQSISNYSMVTYTLKDGRQVHRFYATATSNALGAMLTLDHTNAFHELFNGYMDGMEPEPGNPDRPMPHTTSPFSSGSLYLTSPLSDQAVLVDEALSVQIRQALSEDMETQTIEDRYRPVHLEKYALTFYSDPMLDGKNISYTSNPPILTPDHYDSAAIAQIYLDQSFPKTLALLDENSVKPAEKVIESIHILQPYWDILIDSENHDLSSCFMSTMMNDVRIDSAIRQYQRSPEMTVSDPEHLAELFNVSRGFYYAGDGGYLILVKFQDSKIGTSRYIPRALMPAWAK